MTKLRFRVLFLVALCLAPLLAFAADVPDQLPKPDGKALPIRSHCGTEEEGKSC